ncbi:hypothetical protein GCM10023093_12430 [Nemorincola caseinilytica]|uniref:Uncharacterized protein n=1 Tax=Nemorincola caseinilytica TaxID=2054315 RepID=A0ABP8NDR6_9BACT
MQAKFTTERSAIQARVISLLLPALLFVANTSFGQLGIQSFNSTYTAASTGKSYSQSGAPNSPLSDNDYYYKFGTSSGTSNNILNFSSFSIGSNTYAYRNITNAFVKMRRHDNSLVSGTRQLLWYEATGSDVSDGATLNMRQPYQTDMEVMFNGARGLNAGTDNIFNNSADGNGNNNNIERFDYIIPDGYTVVSNSQEGFIVMDRGVLNAHDPFCVSVITNLNSSDVPSAYTQVLWLNSSHYGSVNPITVMSSNVLRMDEGDSRLRISTTTDANQGIGGVFIRYSDLGIANGTVIYGYSVFGGDFPSGSSGSKVVDWNNSTYFPTNTEPGNGGLDMLCVSGVFQLSNTVAPIANDVARAAICNPNGTGQVSVPALSATDANSGGVISSYKIVAIPSASQGILYYYNGSSYVAASAGLTLTISQSASLKFDPADGYMGDAVFQYTATDNYGLTSNIAYGTIPVYTMPTTTAGSNVTICSGSSTTLNATGATSYTWSPATGLSCTTCASPVANPTSNTTYTITGTHPASGCTSTATIMVSVNASPTINAGSNVTICRGASTTLSGTGGVTYSWSPATGLSCNTCASPVATPTATTTYTLTGTNAVGCSKTATVTVSVNAAPTVGAGSNVTKCAGVATTLSASGASTYVWSPATGLSCTTCSGPSATPTTTTTYTVTGTASNGCTGTASVTVSINPLPEVSVGSGVTICNGGSTTLTATGASSYSWSPSTGLSCTNCASPVANPTSTKTYTVTGTSAAGCVKTASVTVTVTSSPSVSAGSNVTICNGSSTGLSASGATSYTWTSAATLSCNNCANPTATPTTTTTYTVTGTISGGCSATSTVTVSVNPTPATITGSGNVCIGTTTTLSCTTASGTWISGTPGVATIASSNGTVTGVSAGTVVMTYKLTTTGCFNTTVVTVNPSVSASATGTNPTCYSSNNGTVDLTVSGGTPSYTYLWSNGGTTEDLSGLSAGTYTVTVTDAKGCKGTASKTLTQPNAISASAAFTNVNCFGGANGTIDLSVSGGTSPYTYLWSNGATTQDLTGLSAGTYTVTVKDANNCTATLSKTISQPASGVSATATTANTSCYASSNGSINLTASGGTSPYSYNWGGGITTEDRSGLSAGTYSVTVTDNKGCTATWSGTIAQPDVLSASATTVDASCFGGSTGSIDLIVGGGTSPYTYNWGGGITTQDRTGLSAGTYSVTVTDAKGCTATLSKTIGQPAVLSASATFTNVSCNGGANGTIDLSVSGGTTAYTYSWSNGATTQDLTGLSAGTYSVLVTDAKGCTVTVSKTITAPSAVTATTSSTNALCNGCANGTASVSAGGGTPSYTYLWSTGATTSSVSGLAAGTYTVTVKDTKNCQVVNTVTITQPNALVASATNTNVSCNGGTNGTIDLSVSGGTTPYTYNWGGGVTTEDRSGLASGTYSVIVTDANSYTTTATVTITQPVVLAATATSSDVSCNGGANGTIDVSVSGGTAPYTYNWGSGVTTEDRSSLVAGTYSVLVTDNKGCTTTVSKTISQPAALITTAATTDVSCNGGANGMIDMTVSGGTAPYTYAWNNGTTTQDRMGLSAGVYSVTITDAKSCTVTLSKTIGQPAVLSAFAATTNVNCNGGANGTIDLSVSGGTAPYTYSWSNGATTQDLMGLSAGTYSVLVTDAKGCTTTVSKTITAPAVLTATNFSTNALCNGCANGTASVTPSDGTAPYTYQWSTGATTSSVSGLAAGAYTVTIKDANNCTLVVSFTITQPNALVASATNTNVSCNGGTNGTIDLSVSGGTTPYTYNWGGGVTTEDRSGLSSGTYSVIVTDANSYTTTATVTITQPVVLAATATSTDVSCNGGANGTIDASVSGGTAPYTYNWGGGVTTEDRSGLVAGTYSVVVTDAKGCTATVSKTISQPAALTATATTVDVSCNGGANGTIDLTVSGGTSPYTYNWGGGITTQDRTGLSAGTYSVTVTDAKGCTATLSKTIGQPAVLSASATFTNVSCNGAANGAIDLSVSGGTTAYTYNWSNGATTQDLSGLVAGIYSVLVTDAKNCTTTVSKTITAPSAVTATTSSTNALCNGCTNGTASVSAGGGTPSYTYLWSTGATTSSVSGLAAGTYTVTVKDANNCQVVKTVTITQPNALVTSVTNTNVSCNGSANGTIDLSVSGGTAPYTYNWGGGVTTEDRSGLSAGTYSVIVTDANSYTTTATVTITQPVALAATATSTDVSCNGGANGTIDVSVSGGTAPYTYNWGGGVTTEDRSGLVAGTYSVLVTDSKGCTATVSKTISQPAVLTATATTVDVSCNGGSTGSIDMTVSGGTSPYTYNWGGGVTTADRTGLSAGTYSVTVTDNKGCIATLSKTIGQPAVLTASATITNVSCNGGANGTIDLSVSGGTTAYTYSWSNGATTQDLSGLVAGTYSVLVTDAKNCTTTVSKTITASSAVTATTSSTNALCNGCTNGTASVSAGGGTPSYTYLWSTGATTSSVSGLAAGTYTVTVKDANNCQVVKTVTITQPNALVTSVTNTNVSCNGGANGTIDLSVSGGTAPYTYAWSNGASTQDLSGLSAGTYSVVVTDAHGYSISRSVTVTEPATLAASAISENVRCNGEANGSIDVTVTGGTTAYTYNWSNGATTQDVSGLVAGTYSVLVTDAKGCTATVTKTITQPAVLGATASSTNALCYGCNNGTASVTATGGTTPYTYLWSNGATTANVTGLTAGTYTVTVTDAHGCTTVETVTLTQPEDFTASVTNTNVNCNGSNNATADLTVTGGTAPYTYAWSNGASTQDLSGLSAGTYSVVVTDAHGYTITRSATVTEPTTLVASATSENVRCYGEANGSIDVTVTGGTTAYTYNWSNGATTQDITGLVAGTYSVLVTDANGCTATVSKTITQPAVLGATASSTNALCYGCNNGTASVTATGGTTPYTYLWSNGATTANVIGLTAGTYTVTVTDAHGCTTVEIVTLTQPEEFTASVTNTNVNCNGGNNATADLTVSGGTAPYIYAWSNGATSQDLSGLSAGTYSVVVTDAHGYSITRSVTVTEPATLAASAISENVRCYGEANGSIDVTVTGGTTAYTYNWSNGSTTQDLSGLVAGTYSVVVTDANGCTATVTKTITQPAVLGATASSTNALCYGCNNGTASVTATGGATPYTYLWSNGATTANVTGLTSGTYTVAVTDAHGCTTVETVTLTQPEDFTASVTNTNVNCNGGNNATADLTVSGGTAPYTYTWSNGATSQDLSGLSAGTYSVVITDAHGYSITRSVTVTEPTTLVASATSENVRCYGEANGSIDLSVSGGTTAYTYNWSNGATTQDLSGLVAGTYSVLVTDTHGCTATVTKTITQPAVLGATASSTNALCYGCNNGTASVTATGGTTSYTYLWSNGATTANVTGLTAGTYTVTVTDAHGCTTVETVTLTQPEEFTASVTNTNVNCNGGNNATADLTVSGGTAPYTYVWSNGATSQDLSGLAAGTYSVVVTDAHGYSITRSVTVTEPATLAASAVSANVTCTGAANGSIGLTVSGGTATYTYSWSNGAITQDLSGLTPGTYSVLVTDAHGCTATTSKTITQPAPIAESCTANQVGCYGGTTGALNITVTGGTTPYTYNWSNGATTEDVSGLMAGTYSVAIADANGCTLTKSYTLTQPAAVVVTNVVNNVTCNGLNNGSVDLTVSGGTAPYTYTWNTGATTQDMTGMAPGTYTVTVKDAHLCKVIRTYNITQPAAISVLEAKTNVSCNGGNNGAINITVSGGTTPYSFVWSNGATTEDVTALTSGTYSVTVTDANGCVKTRSYSITQPAVLAASATSTNVTCNGGSNGAIDANITGGVTPYTYSWSNGATTEDLAGATAGTYTLTATDANGCTATIVKTITEPAPMALTGTTNHVVCGCLHGMGEIYLTVAGGTAPYTYLWSDGTTNQNDTGLWTGTYSVVVTDLNGCTATGSYSVVSPWSMSVYNDVTNVSRHGANNGAIELAVTGGIAPYTFVWSNGATSQNLSGLAPGTYSVVITDANGCTRDEVFTITQPTQMVVNGVVADATCHGDNGSINISVAGGAAPYTFNWSNGVTTEDLTAGAGTYTLTVQDGNGCTDTRVYTITQPTPIVLTGTTNHVICGCAHGMGEIYLDVTGGVGPYTFMWSDGTTNQNDTGLWTGTYSVILWDNNGCEATAEYSVISPESISVYYEATNVSCNGASNGSIELAVSGGIAPYSYSWNTGATTSSISGLSAGTYSVSITDANGCTRPEVFTIAEPAVVSITGSVTNVLCSEGATGGINITVSGGTAPYTYSWSNGATTEDATGLGAGTYTVTATDANGCSAAQVYTITHFGTTVVTIGDGASNACTGTTSAYTATPAGGVWSTSSSAIATVNATGVVTPVAAGNVILTYSVTNACGTFYATKAITVNVTPSIPAIIGGAAAVCTGTLVGLANTVTGGSWSSSNTAVATVGSTGTVTTVGAGTATITYTKSNVCGTSYATRTVTVHGTPSAGTISGPTNVCVGGIVPLTSTVPGGNWSNGTPLIAITCPCNSGQVTGIAPGVATLSYSVSNACGTAHATYTVTVRPVPTVTTSLIAPVVAGHGPASMPFTTTGTPNTYSIVWSTGAAAAGFTNISGAIITTSPMSITVPASATEGTYTGALTVSNGYCTSTAQNINITVNQSVNIYTFAGNGTAGYSGNDNAATIAKLGHPYNVAVDCNGNAYIADYDNAVIRKVSPTGVITTVAGNGTIGYSGDGGPATAAKISHAQGIILDAAGNLYFTDYNNHAVRKVSTSGIITRVTNVGTGYTGDGGPATAARVSYPSGLTLDGSGNLYIADAGNSVVRKVTPSGIITTVAGTGVSGYAGDNGPATSAKLFSPIAVHADASGNLLICDMNNQVVRKVDASGTITTIAGNGVAGYIGDGGVATAAKLNGPSGVTTDNSGNIYFSERGNSVVRKVNSAGIISTIAGNTVPGYSGDGGPALLAKLRQPTSLARDCAGHIYIADMANNVIRIMGQYNRVPFFRKGATQTIDVCTGSTPIAIDTNLAVTDFDTTQTETWSVVSGPAHGTLVAGHTTVSTGSLLTPSGLSYTPASGYVGADAFVVKVNDGTANAITTINVTVSVPPVAGVVSGTTALCGTGGTQFTTTGTGGVWKSSDTTIARVNATGFVGGVGYGTATISYVVTNACGTAVATKTVTYNPVPTVSTVVGAAKVCRGSSVVFSNATPGGIWSSMNTAKATVDADGRVYGIDTGMAAIRYAVTNSCGTAFGVRNITVEILPVVGPISGPTNVCAGSAVTFTNATPAGAWYSSNTAVATVGIVSGAVTGVSVGTAVISYVHNTSCGVVTTTRSIMVDPTSVTIPAIGGAETVCPGTTATLTNSMTGGTWSAAYNTVLSIGSATGIVTGLSAGTANVTYTLTHACGTSYVVRTMTVNPMPVVTPITGTMSICVGWTITAANATPGGVWSSSNTALATVNSAGYITGIAGGMPVISYSVSNMCGTVSATAIVPVGTTPPVAAISGPSATCVGADVTLTNSTVGGTWSSGNTAVANVSSAGIVTGVGAGTTTITYSVHNGCGYSTATKAVSINPLPVVSTITGPSNVCIGADIDLDNAIPGGVWTSSNPAVATVGSTGIVVGVTTGTTTISYSVTNGCGTAVATKNVSVQVMFASIYTSHVSSIGGNDGCALLTVVGGVAPYTFLWSNGATTQNLSGLYAGVYSVLVTDANGDTASATATVTGLAARGTNGGSDISEGGVGAMYGAHPNPFVTSSVIRFNLPEGKHATIDVFNAATGAKVATIFNDVINPGEEYTATIDGNNIPAGMYIYRISTELTSYLGKVVLVK